MANDDLSEVDVINILQRGLVEEPEWEHGEWRYQVRTQKMTAVVSLHEEPDRVVLVTVWRQNRADCAVGRNLANQHRFDKVSKLLVSLDQTRDVPVPSADDKSPAFNPPRVARAGFLDHSFAVSG